MRLSCHEFNDNVVRLALFVLAYNLGNFLRRLVLPVAMARWSVTGILADYGKAPELSYDEANYVVGDGRVPVFRNVACFGGRGDNIEKTVELIRAATPERRPAFLHVFVINWWNTPADLVKVMEELGDGYEACTASQFIDLWRRSGP